MVNEINYPVPVLMTFENSISYQESKKALFRAREEELLLIRQEYLAKARTCLEEIYRSGNGLAQHQLMIRPTEIEPVPPKPQAMHFTNAINYIIAENNWRVEALMPQLYTYITRSTLNHYDEKKSLSDNFDIAEKWIAKKSKMLHLNPV